MAAKDLSVILPRVLIVSRRCLRKNKFVDFVGEYHLDLIVAYGAVPVIVPQVSGVHMLLDSFEPIHGVLLCEGEDIDPSLYAGDSSDAVVGLSPAELDEIRQLHSSDTAIDQEKDTIEMRLAKLCLERNVPYLGICQGSQVLNVACGGYPELELKCVNNITSIVLSSINYQVLGIFLNTGVMSLVREDYSSGQICSPVLTNSTFDPAVFGSANELVDPSLGFETDYSVRRMATNVAELAFRCLQHERDMRPTMKEVLEALRKIQLEEAVVGLENAEVVDILSEEMGPLRHHLHPPLSPDSSMPDKWNSSSSLPPHSF